MRLRRETGDWTIRVNEAFSGATLITTQLPKGLSAEDFVGAVIEIIADTDTNYMYANVSTASGLPYNVTISLGIPGKNIYYDRRSGHLSLDPEDFDPVEPDEDGDEVLFTIASETGEDITPNVLDTGLGSEYFIGKKVKTDKGTYTITGDMIDGLSGGIKIRYKGWNNSVPKISYDADDGTVTHVPTSGDDGDEH